MTGPPTDLRELIELAMSKRGVSSLRQLALLAQSNGYSIVNATLSQMRSGTYPVNHPSKQTLEALSFLAGVSVERVRAAAGMRPMPQISLAEQMPEDVDLLLTAKQKRIVLDVARGFADAQKALMDSRHALESQRYLTSEDLDELDEPGDDMPPSEDQASST